MFPEAFYFKTDQQQLKKNWLLFSQLIKTDNKLQNFVQPDLGCTPWFILKDEQIKKNHNSVYWWNLNAVSNVLTHYQTTNFRLFQTQRVCRLQFKFNKNGRRLSKLVKNTVGKGEIACYEQFLLFPQYFQKARFPGASKGVIVWEWVKVNIVPVLYTSVFHCRNFFTTWQTLLLVKIKSKS